MKKLLITLIVAMGLMFPTAAQADFVSTLDFEGFFHYSGAGDLDADELFCDFIECDEGLGTEEDGYFALGAFAWEIDLNIPEGTFPYWLEWELDGNLEVMAEGETVFDEEFDEEDLAGLFGIPTMIDLGELDLDQEEVEDLLAFLGVEIDGFLDDAGFLREFDGDLESGFYLFAHDENIFGVGEGDALWLEFEGNVTLTAHGEGGEEESNAIPEPASMLLFASGLMGLAGVKRRKV